MIISDFDLEIKFTRGKNLGGPDAISRCFTDPYIPVEDDRDEEELTEVMVSTVKQVPRKALR